MKSLNLDDHIHDGGMKDRIDHLRSRGVAKVNEWKPVARRRIAEARGRLNARLGSMQNEVRSNPAKWAGIAAGVGLGIGLAGRMIRNRMRSEEIPSIVILEAC